MKALFAKAFAIWEDEFRADPSRFMTTEQAAAADLLPLAEARAECLASIIDAVLAGEFGAISDTSVGGAPNVCSTSVSAVIEQVKAKYAKEKK